MLLKPSSWFRSLSVATLAFLAVATVAYAATSIGTDITTAGVITSSNTGSTSFVASGAPAASTTSSLIQLGSAIVGGSASGTFLGLNAASGYAGNLLDLQVNGGSKLVITGAGLVGIGTEGPVVALDVVGDGIFTNTTTNLSITATGDDAASIISLSNTNGGTSFSINNSPSDGSVTLSAGQGGLNILTASIDHNITYAVSGDGYHNFIGNVGIGKTSPGSALDVKGTLRLSGATSGYVGLAPAADAGSTTYTLPSSDGTNGQVLSTNGSGTLSWSGVKVYRAVVAQSGTSAPTATVLENTLGETVTYSYGAPGTYFIAKPTAFDANKFFVSYTSAVGPVLFTFSRVGGGPDIGKIGVVVKNVSLTSVDNQFAGYLEILVYP